MTMEELMLKKNRVTNEQEQETDINDNDLEENKESTDNGQLLCG